MITNIGVSLKYIHHFEETFLNLEFRKVSQKHKISNESFIENKQKYMVYTENDWE